MPGKTHVSVKCDVKDAFDPKLKPALVKALTAEITSFIDNKSGGVLSTTEKSAASYVLTASLVSLKADDKTKPTKLDAKVIITVIAVGVTAKGFTGSSGGSATGIGSNVESEAKDLVKSIIQDLMPQAIKNMPKL